MTKVLKAASKEESRVAGSNIFGLSSWEDNGLPHCWKGYGKRDRCEDKEDDSISNKYEEPGTTNSK